MESCNMLSPRVCGLFTHFGPIFPKEVEKHKPWTFTPICTIKALF